MGRGFEWPVPKGMGALARPVRDYSRLEKENE
ncbi:hypothetical protein LINGRAHAP2_LOCUS31471 [Linum grandiflorum]